MDADRLDAVARSLHRIARRTALGGVFGTGLAALIARFDTEDAETKRKKRRKKKRKKCKGDQKKCGKRCIPKTDCCGCSQESCCDGECVDLATDPNNCGGCGQACPAVLCVHGVCACLSDEECPDSCFCVFRAQGVSACSTNDDLGPECTVDDDCPLGRFCLQIDETRVCSSPCPA